MNVPVSAMLSKDYAAQRRLLMKQDRYSSCDHNIMNNISVLSGVSHQLTEDHHSLLVTQCISVSLTVLVMRVPLSIATTWALVLHWYPRGVALLYRYMNQTIILQPRTDTFTVEQRS